MFPKQALIQADLDYQKADIDQKIQHYIAASQGHSAELDSAFIMGIEIGLSILVSVQIIQRFYFNFRCGKCACIRGIVGWNGFWNWHSHI